MLNLINSLKENQEDFEFYPTTDEMLKIIYNRLKQYRYSFLDIGAGDCRIFNKFNKWYKENEKNKDYDYFSHNTNYCIVEKSKILLQKAPKEAIVVGVDFKNLTLIDKEIDCIFCNPPYSEFEEWSIKIIEESNFKNYIYLIIPTRWKENKLIQEALNRRELKADIIYTGDFLNADRQARCNIDIVEIKGNFDERRWRSTPVDPFKIFFENTFNIKAQEKEKSNWDKENNKKEKLREELTTTDQGHLIDRLVEFYNRDMNNLCQNYKKIGELDESLLAELNIDLNKLMSACKLKIQGLKNLYWNELFNNLKTITDRLTAKSRQDFFDKLKKLGSIDFNKDNAIEIVLWIIKNANDYFKKQLIEVFENLTSEENIINYKSNQKTWDKEKWRFNKKEITHYKLDYRIITNAYARQYSSPDIIKDVCTIANNLGFSNNGITSDILQDGKKIIARWHYTKNNENYIEDLFEVRWYKNEKAHFKINIEFMKAFNIEVSRILGWIKNKEDIKADMDYTDDDIKKYYNSNICLTQNNLLLLSNDN